MHSTARGVAIHRSLFSGNRGVQGGAIRLGADMGSTTAVFKAEQVVISSSRFEGNKGVDVFQAGGVASNASAIWWDRFREGTFTDAVATTAGASPGGCIFPPMRC